MELTVLLPLDVDQVLLDLLLSNLLPELSLSLLAHELGKDLPEHGELGLFPVLHGLYENSLNMLFVMHVFFPGSELLAHRARATPHDVITQELVCLVLSGFFLVLDE